MGKEGLTKDRLEILCIIYTLLLKSLKRERSWCIKRNRLIPDHPEVMIMCQKIIDEINEDDEPEINTKIKKSCKTIAQKLFDFLKTNNSINKDNIIV